MSELEGMRKTNRQILHMNGLTVELEDYTGRGLIDEIGAFLSGTLCHRRQPCVWRVELRTSTRPPPDCQRSQRVTVARREDGPDLSFRSWHEVDGRVMLVNDDSKVRLRLDTQRRRAQLVSHRRAHDDRLNSGIVMDAASLCRLIARKSLEASGWSLLHGALVGLERGNVLVCGDKGGGKTSVQLALLSQSGGRFGSSDRTYVGECGGRAVASGFPDAVRAFPDTLAALPWLDEEIRWTAIAGGKLAAPAGHFTPLCSESGFVALAAVVLCRFERRRPASLRSFPKEEARRLLVVNDFTRHDPVYEDWLAQWMPTPRTASEPTSLLTTLPWLVFEGEYQLRAAIEATREVLDRGA